MSHPSRSLKDSSAESNVNYGGPAQEDAEGNNISNRDRDHSSNNLAKKWVLFTLVLRICLKLNFELNFVGSGDLKMV